MLSNGFRKCSSAKAWVKYYNELGPNLVLPPFVTVDEEEVVVDDGVQSVGEEVREVVKVLDANTLQELHIPDENGRPGPLVHNTKSEKQV